MATNDHRLGEISWKW